MNGAVSRFRLDYWYRGILVAVGLVVLVAVYIYQKINIALLIGEFSPPVIFIINRTVRLILNDLACFLIILGVFQDKRSLRIAFYVFLAEALIILPLYLAVKLTMEGDSEISSPLLSQFHRLIVNPMLMLLLIAGLFYQRHVKPK